MNCPKCDVRVTDTTGFCPQCYTKFDAQFMAKLKEELGEHEVTHSPRPRRISGGHKITNTKKVNNVPKISIKTVFIIVFAILCISVGTVFFIQEQAKRGYISDLKLLCEEAIRGGTIAEDLCSLTYKVWHNSIYKERNTKTDEYTLFAETVFHDFELSLILLYEDSKTKNTIEQINTSRENMDKIIKKLQNPPKSLTTCYSTADSLYDAFCSLANLAKSPSGSLQSYSRDYRTYSDNLVKYYEKLNALISEK